MTLSERAVEHLSQAVQIATVSYHDQSKVCFERFDQFEDFLIRTYPLVHERFEKHKVNGHGLAFRWCGEHSEEAPVLLTAHYDVVPAEPENWPYPPFSGTLADNKVWGRGTLDDKGSLIALMETAEVLLKEGFKPPRDIWFAFGFDEECNGLHGAAQISVFFREKGLHFEFVLDEGGIVVDGSMMGIKPPIAVIGLAEKGNSSFEFTFKGEAGHTAAPPAHSSLGKMAAFIKDVEDHPLPARLTPTVEGMLTRISAYMPGLSRTVTGNPSLFFPLLKKILLKQKQTASMLRTTVSFTMASCGTAPNVLPPEARCVANVRILQGDSVESVLQWFRSFDHDFSVRALAEEEPTPAASTESDGFKHLTHCIHEIFPEAVPAPYLMTGGTDCRHYIPAADNCYRFLPVHVNEKELGLMHAAGEYLSTANVEKMLAFYRLFISEL